MAKGLEGMVRNLSRQKSVGAPQLMAAGLVLQAEAMRITPVDTSHLIGSCYTNPVVDKGDKLSVEVGYWADYAAYVHEMPESTNWQKPKAENKFLERAMMRNEQKLLAIMGAKSGGCFVK